MSELSAEVRWRRRTPALEPGRYATDHDISYNAAQHVKGDAAPDWGGDPDCVNPEQALAASLSSCHMMTFLALAAKSRWPVATYTDHAVARLGKTKDGRMAVTDILLNPKVTFDEGFFVVETELQKMHDRAHRYCFIANSVTATVSISMA